MRLVNTGPGEWSDRLTILSLKILVGTEKGKDVAHFQTEQTALLQLIRGRTLNGSWFEAVLELAAVNGQLWQAEDELREYRACGLRTAEPVITCAYRIQSLNDRRAELVHSINANAGEPPTQEKL